MVVLVVVAIAAVVGLANALRFGGRSYSEVGRGELSLDKGAPSAPVSQAVQMAEAEAEIRQLVEAKSARRVARGEAPLDVEREVTEHMARLHGPAVDDDLREEVRQLVVARNERRAARGEDRLDVDTEVERELRRLS